MRDIELDIFLLDKTSTWNGRKTDGFVEYPHPSDVNAMEVIGESNSIVSIPPTDGGPKVFDITL